MLIVASYVLFKYFKSKIAYYRKFTSPKGAYREQVQEWINFHNMARDIQKFDKVPFEGLVVWNRVLVYATMYGYATKVEEFIKINNLSTFSPELNTIAPYVSHVLYRQVNIIDRSLSSADSASHFSVSSDGSSGGSVGSF